MVPLVPSDVNRLTLHSPLLGTLLARSQSPACLTPTFSPSPHNDTSVRTSTACWVLAGADGGGADPLSTHAAFCLARTKAKI